MLPLNGFRNRKEANYARLGIEFLENRITFAADVWTGKGETPSWDNVSNWSLNRLPTINDVAIISKSVSDNNPIASVGDNVNASSLIIRA